MSDSSSNDTDVEYGNLEESGSDESEESDLESDEICSDEDHFHLSRTWCAIDTDQPPPAPPRFSFVGTPGCTFPIPDGQDVLAYYQLFVDDYLINLLVTETNRFAQQQPGSSATPWAPVTVAEMHIFLAIKILQGIVKKPQERMYWSTAEVFQTPIFSKLFTYQRFYQIQRYLHFADNVTYNSATHPHPKLNKIWPVYENLNGKFSSLYIPERDVSIDESLMMYKGRLSWIQYLPLKRARFGIKLYLLCESKSGYVHSSIIYAGKGTLISNKYKNWPMSSQIVLSLMEPLLNLGYCVTTDNFYTSPQLADFLAQRKTDSYGTMRMNRQEVPKEIREKKLKKGEITAFQRGKVMVLKWRDKKDVCMLSTVHNSARETTKKRDKDGGLIKKPKVIIDYNNTMGGVDRLDQHLHDYPIARKRGKKYYKKIFFHLLDMSLWNAFVLYNKNGGQKNNLQFRQALIEKLIENFHSTSSTRKGRPSYQPGPLRLTERHFPEYVPPTKKKAAPCRYCAVCCNKKNKEGKRPRKETRYYCKSCDVGLCAVPCFMEYHTKLNFCVHEVVKVLL
ncbi:piggyBac transposable element-derived protein 4-like [Onthophagus taurus]|uniref:piggyBac transposable element-derived protein 4-like n=1 Tax=Onthophagus taurus TaxID=166361 RepID=UPI0039BE7905